MLKAYLVIIIAVLFLEIFSGLRGILKNEYPYFIEYKKLEDYGTTGLATLLLIWTVFLLSGQR